MESHFSQKQAAPIPAPVDPLSKLGFIEIQIDFIRAVARTLIEGGGGGGGEVVYSYIRVLPD